MPTRTGQAVQISWTSLEEEGVWHLEDLFGGPLSKGRLKGVLEEEASTLRDKLLRGECEWNGGDPCTKDSLISKAKKLRGKKEQKKGKEKEKVNEKEEKKKKNEEKEKKFLTSFALTGLPSWSLQVR